MGTTLSTDLEVCQKCFLQWIKKRVTAVEFEEIKKNSAVFFLWLEEHDLYPDDMTDEDSAEYQEYAKRYAVRRDE